ncbi:MAG: hypothetical protein ACEQSC_02250, partial [Candidatus Nanopelagicaceae bacterium]
QLEERKNNLQQSQPAQLIQQSQPAQYNQDASKNILVMNENLREQNKLLNNRYNQNTNMLTNQIQSLADQNAKLQASYNNTNRWIPQLTLDDYLLKESIKKD